VNSTYHTNLQPELWERFIKLLASDGRGLVFQVFDDSPEKDRKLPRVIPGSAQEGIPRLRARHPINRAGAYVTVNEKPMGWVEKMSSAFAVSSARQTVPSCPRYRLNQQSSPGHCHQYLLVADDWPTDERALPISPMQWRGWFETYGSDKNTKDPARVLRLPGLLQDLGFLLVPRQAQEKGRDGLGSKTEWRRQMLDFAR